MEKSDVAALFQSFERQNPRPQTELIYTTPFSFLVSVILSAQATDKSVNKVMETLRPKVETPEAVLAVGLPALTESLKSINYFQNKAKNIVTLSKILVEHFQSCIPLNFSELVKLPGVGRKTANVLLVELAQEERIAVDTHVLRVSQRLGLSGAQTPETLERDLYDVVPRVFWSRTNHWLVLHGRYVCTARNPQCSSCFVKGFCKSFQEGLS
ncbi:endonuclease III [Alphaproteobacteria bacterium]|nr:endonuclease III [Alphaproteobacteria bacterium]GHS95901.1 endonuclease III [Alphaproteobacteria bacterium]